MLNFMENILKNKYAKWGMLVLLAFAVLFLVLRVITPRNQPVLGLGGYFEGLNYNAIGTATVPVTLTNSYTAAGSASSTQMGSLGLPNISVSGEYTPKSYGSVAYILVERSIDGGVSYQPYQTITPEVADVLLNTNGSSTTNGSPFIVPGNALFTSASGTAIGFSFDVSLVADYVKIFVKESTTSTAGVFYAQVKATSN